MPRYTPISRTEHLPPIGTIEGETLDFKAKHNKSDALYERGKDIGALANRFGGTILIGAADKNDTLTIYVPLTPSDASDARRDYENAAENLCSSKPVVTFATISKDAGVVLAVNVEPFADRVIGVRKTGDPDFWTFPQRVASRTAFLTPEQMAMYSSAQFRRSLILLHSIPPDHEVIVRFLHGHGTPGEGVRAKIGKILEAENTIVFVPIENQFNEIRFPIDQVRTVFKESKAWWVCLDALA